MPRTIQDILEHGEALAKRFEDYEPRPGKSATRRSSQPCVDL